MDKNTTEKYTLELVDAYQQLDKLAIETKGRKLTPDETVFFVSGFGAGVMAATGYSAKEVEGLVVPFLRAVSIHNSIKSWMKK